jgi:hypothetical protein
VSTSAFVLVDAVLPVGNHTISEYLRPMSDRPAEVRDQVQSGTDFID